MDDAAFGKRFKLAREALGCSVVEFAELSGLSRNYLYQVERGEKAMSVPALRKCARLMGVTTDHLLGLTARGGPKKRR